MKWMPDKSYIKLLYRVRMGKKCNIENPVTFNEKIQWLKLYDRKPVYSIMVDKVRARKYVAGVIGDSYINPIIGTYDSFDDINFDDLPDEFVIKCNHDSGSCIICTDKDLFNIADSRAKINKHMKKEFFYSAREWPYKDMEKKVFIEEYLDDIKGDYRLWTFNGKVQYIAVVLNLYTAPCVLWYNRDWELLPFRYKRLLVNEPEITKIERPDELNEMIEAAEKLAKDIPFARVDFLCTEKKIIFSEITFSPESGFTSFSPDKYDKIMGDLIELPAKTFKE